MQVYIAGNCCKLDAYGAVTCVITVMHMHLEPYTAGRSIIEHNFLGGGDTCPLDPPILTVAYAS